MYLDVFCCYHSKITCDLRLIFDIKKSLKDTIIHSNFLIKIKLHKIIDVIFSYFFLLL